MRAGVCAMPALLIATSSRPNRSKRKIDRRAAMLRLRDGAGEPGHVEPVVLQRLRQRLHPLGVEVRKNEPCALLREQPRGGAAEAAGRAGDEDRQPIVTHHFPAHCSPI